LTFVTKVKILPGRRKELPMIANVRLGRHGPEVPALGLGCMGLSGAYGAADERKSIATVHAALDAGISFLDTGDY